MLTYTTLGGQVLDLTGLTEDERAYLVWCWREARNGTVTWHDLVLRNHSIDNPLVHATAGWVTRAVWDHPLFSAARDLEHRVGLAQGALAPEGEHDPGTDPFADRWLSIGVAARRKRVPIAVLHDAIGRGEVIVRVPAPGDAQLRVSANSLARWTPRPAHPTARRLPADVG